MYAFERWALAEHVKKRRKELTIEKTLLGNPELAIPLANYMDGTGRFRAKIGEHPHSQNGNTARETIAGSPELSQPRIHLAHPLLPL